MSEAENLFEHLVIKFEKKNGVAKGKMMSSPALKCKGKVFAFYHNEEMGFKLGKEFEPKEHGLKDWSYLSPFKNKPPMKAWFMIPYSEKAHWESLTSLALDKMAK